jgi:hypothetical protein
MCTGPSARVAHVKRRLPAAGGPGESRGTAGALRLRPARCTAACVRRDIDRERRGGRRRCPRQGADGRTRLCPHGRPPHGCCPRGHCPHGRHVQAAGPHLVGRDWPLVHCIQSDNLYFFLHRLGWKCQLYVYRCKSSCLDYESPQLYPHTPSRPHSGVGGFSGVVWINFGGPAGAVGRAVSAPYPRVAGSPLLRCPGLSSGGTPSRLFQGREARPFGFTLSPLAISGPSRKEGGAPCSCLSPALFTLPFFVFYVCHPGPLVVF